MGFSIETGISAFTVFVQGLLSFFSPCVLPLVPLYLGYLSGGLNMEQAKTSAAPSGDGRAASGDGASGQEGAGRAGNSAGSLRNAKLRLFLRVLCFTLGISGAFFVLGLGASAAGSFFSEQRMLFARIGGILVIFFGLYQLGVFGSSKILGEEHRLPFHIGRMTMSPVTAFLMGFAFSFAWTPCVGPALTSVLLMAGSASSAAKGFLLIGVYTLGFILPFLAAGIFTAQLLGAFKRHRNIVRYTVKAGGVLMILLGVLMFTGKMNDITGYLSGTGQQGTAQSQSVSDESGSGSQNGDNAQDADDAENGGNPQDAGGAQSGDSAQDAGTAGSGSVSDGETDGQETGNGNGSTSGEDEEKQRAYEFEMTDQYGNTHTLAQYEGKVIFLNFWATWCGPCRNEMPDIQKLYEEYASQGEDAEVVILGVAAPGFGQEGSREEIVSFMEENGYTYPVLMDGTGEMFSWYGISAFPTTFMIDKEGNVFGYVTGQMTEDIMRSIIEQTLG
ncbi:redoxin domain-containing protein [Ruminococcus sp. CLA-AA-H200]|uniref:Redoxin domain-containing protein n=1 Tax=Ruminococcus turbiniformis TaxID=2881258 RepID=A0ABS8FVE7_9FIRM|nr:cytochrome c biogenesis protein CcdA [Ruminococcus turbiniformis]MCC2253333.1 redoxin domain-containing protein [Ruminococcus turbiniformis]